MKSKSGSYPTALCALAWVVLAAATVAVVWARVRLAGLPLERDEGEYAYTGQLLLRGIAPYRLAYSMKFPGTAAIYAVLMSIFGESSNGIHFGLLMINLLTAGLMFLLGRKIFGELGGILAAAAYLVLSLMPHVLGQAAHATHFIVFFACAGALVLMQALDRQSRTFIFASGCLFGIALLMKQPGFFFVLFGALYLVGHDWREHLSARKIVLRNLLLLCGAAVPCLLTGIALLAAGVFRKFWFWTIQYAAQYGGQVSFGEGLRVFTDHFWGTLGTAWPIWLLAVLGFVACGVSAPIRSRAGFLTTWSICSAIAVCPGFYFRPHYFILLLPALSLLAAATATAAVGAFAKRSRNFQFVPLLVFAACLFWPLWSERDFFFQRPLTEANRMVNGTNPFPESVQIGDYLRGQTTPSDAIVVLGSEPQIYFYAQRRSATGYIYTYGLMEPQPYAHQMQEEMIHEIETARPKFLVLVVVGKSWLAGRDSDKTIFRWADNYCDANYQEVGLVNISDQGSEYYLSAMPVNVTPTAEHILIFRRKD